MAIRKRFESREPDEPCPANTHRVGERLETLLFATSIPPRTETYTQSTQLGQSCQRYAGNGAIVHVANIGQDQA